MDVHAQETLRVRVCIFPAHVHGIKRSSIDNDQACLAVKIK